MALRQVHVIDAIYRIGLRQDGAPERRGAVFSRHDAERHTHADHAGRTRRHRATPGGR